MFTSHYWQSAPCRLAREFPPQVLAGLAGLASLPGLAELATLAAAQGLMPREGLETA